MTSVKLQYDDLMNPVIQALKNLEADQELMKR